MREGTVKPPNYSTAQQTYIYTYLYPINLEFERERNSIAGDKFNFTRVHQGLATLHRWGIE